MKDRKNPLPTVDVIIELGTRGIVLVERKNPPYGWALPGGFVDEGESVEEAALREALEETGLEVTLLCQMHAYSDPKRDPRFHTITVVFAATAGGEPKAGDDAKGVGVFKETALPSPMAFDHARILRDYFKWKKEGFAVFRLNG
ncbi:MAG: NUDIX hydrolase [Deltaproteobacteria bacterium]|nr:NUDIX hydrolase [Deltaproteobacteria bacterium]